MKKIVAAFEKRKKSRPLSSPPLSVPPPPLSSPPLSSVPPASSLPLPPNGRTPHTPPLPLRHLHLATVSARGGREREQELRRGRGKVRGQAEVRMSWPGAADRRSTPALPTSLKQLQPITDAPPQPEINNKSPRPKVNNSQPSLNNAIPQPNNMTPQTNVNNILKPQANLINMKPQPNLNNMKLQPNLNNMKPQLHSNNMKPQPNFDNMMAQTNATPPQKRTGESKSQAPPTTTDAKHLYPPLSAVPLLSQSLIGGLPIKPHPHMPLHAKVPPTRRGSETTLLSLLIFCQSGPSNSMGAIDKRIEQAMDLVKTHLMVAVREEVDLLRDQVKALQDRNAQLERENYILRALKTQSGTDNNNTHR